MNLAVRVLTDHAYRMLCLKCELPHLLEVSRPPDPELIDLIKQAFLEGQIDSRKADLAYTFPTTRTRRQLLYKGTVKYWIQAGQQEYYVGRYVVLSNLYLLFFFI